MRARTYLVALILGLVALPGVLHASDPADPYWLTFPVSQEIDYPMAPHNFGGFGFAAADVDNDGDVDLYLPTDEGTPDVFLRNVDGVFVDDTDSFLDSSADAALLEEPSGTALWVDHDGDRFLDLLVLSDCADDISLCAGTPNARLYRQLANGRFVDVAADAGLDAVAPLFSIGRSLGGLAAGDLNEDELPDFYIGLFRGSAGFLDGNLAHILLSDASDPAQVTYTHVNDIIGNPRVDTWICPVPAPPPPPDCSVTCDPDLQGSHWTTIFYDFNDDDRLDLLSAIDGIPVTLWLTPAPGVDVTTGLTNAASDAEILHSLEDPDRVCEEEGSGSFIAGTDMGIGISDYDNDGRFDFYFTNTNTQEPRTIDAFYRATSTTSPSGTPVYEDVIGTTGIAPQGGLNSWGWGVTFFDANLDGYEDLAFTNGYTAPGFETFDASRFFLNASFHPLSAIPDFIDLSGDVCFNDTNSGKGLGAFDFDRDGDPDLIQTFDRATPAPGGNDGGLRILENVLDPVEPARQWLTIRPRMIGKNTFAIGAVVRATVTYDDKSRLTMSRLISAGESFVTQEPYEAHFGLGNQNMLGSKTITDVCVTIEWPGGTEDPTEIDVPLADLDQVITVGWCGPTDFAAPYGTLDSADWDEVLALHAAGDPIVDYVPDGVFNQLDLIIAGSLANQGCPTATIPIDFDGISTCH